MAEATEKIQKDLQMVDWEADRPSAAVCEHCRCYRVFHVVTLGGCKGAVLSEHHKLLTHQFLLLNHIFIYFLCQSFPYKCSPKATPESLNISICGFSD